MSSIVERSSVILNGDARPWRALVAGLLLALCAFAGPGRLQAQPANDQFTNATIIAGSFGTVNGTTVNATIETGEPFHFASYRARSVWFRWTAPASGRVTFDTIGSGFDTILAAYTGTNVSALTRLASNDDNGGFLSSLITFSALAGTEYSIAIDGFAGSSGVYLLNWTQGSCTNLALAAGEISFSCVDYSVAENTPGFVTITVQAGAPFPGDVTVDYFTTDGTALAGADYLTTSNTLTLLAGQTNASFTVSIQDNAVQNPNKTVNLTLTNAQGGAVLAGVSNAVLTIVDDETPPFTSQAGEFGFSTGTFRVTENETVPAPYSLPSSLNARSARGAIVTVTRTAGASGRVLVDVGVFSNPARAAAAVPGVEFTPVTNTLVFDDYQMSASFLVPVFSDGIANGDGIIDLVLLNPRPDPTEDSANIIPTVGLVGNSTIQIVEANLPLTLNIERATYRVDEYSGTVSVDIIRPPISNPDTFRFRIPNAYGYVLQAGSDYTDQSTRLLPNTPYTDGSLDITNTPDYVSPLDVNVTIPAFSGRVTVTLVITNDATVEFNEDILIEILAIPGVTQEAIGQNSTANVTILYDEQAAGQADREWNPEGISSTQPPFNATPGANNIVAAVAVQPDGRTVLVGDFTAVNSVSRFRVARMNPDGSLDLSFNPGSGADGFVQSLIIYPSNSSTTTNGGKILIGGGFSAFNNVSRRGIARLNANGTLDTSFNPGNGADGTVHSLALQSDGKVLVAGDFTHWNDVPVSGIMRLNVDGSLDTGFTPGTGADNTVWAVAVRDTAQTIFIPRNAAGTDFEDVNVVETGATEGSITVDYNFYSIADNIRIYYEGVLLTNLTITGSGFVTLNYGPGTSTSFTIIMNEGTGLPGTVWDYRVRVTPVITGRTIYLGGDFTSFNGVTRNGVARLLDDGTLDTSFNPGLGVDDSIYALAVQADNKLIMGGAFTRFHTSDRNSIVRLRNDGSLDEDYNVGSGFDAPVFNITLQPDNKALFGGVFQSFNGVRRMAMARLFVNGSLDTSFMDSAYNQFAGLPKTYAYDPPRYVRSMALQPDGNIMIGGSFTNLGGNYSISRSLRNNYTVFTRADKTTRFNVARILGGYTPGPGNLEYDPAALPFTIDENAGTFYATMRRVDGRLGTAQVIATNFNNTALNPADFESLGLARIWPEFNYVAPRSVGDVGLDYFPIPINEDLLQEGDETFGIGAVLPLGSITLGGEFVPLGLARGHLDVSQVAIADNDFSHGMFVFSTKAYITNENAGFAVITVIRTNGSSGAVSVDYMTRPGVSSPATTNADFTPVRGTLSFTAGQTVRTFNVPIANDFLVEFDENISLVLSNATGGATLPTGTGTAIEVATLTIIDNDFLQGRLNFSVENYTNSENDAVAAVTVTRTGGNVGAMTVQVRTGNGTATSPADFTGVTNTLSWADGDSSAKTFTIPLVADGIVEGTETVSLFLFNPAINGALGGRTNATLYVQDADNYGAISFSQIAYAEDENGSAPAITLVRSGGIAGTVTVTYATSPLVAVPGTDYNDVTGNIIFYPGETSHTFIVPILDDAVADGDQTVQLTLSNPINGSLGAISNAVLTLVDNESVNLPAGSQDTTFSSAAQANAAVYALALQTDGRIIMAGDFTLVNNVPHNRIARLKDVGTLDSSFDIGPGANGSIRALALQNDGKLLIGGLFTVVNSTNRNGIARLATDGSLDAFFNPGAGADNPVYAITVQADDKILAGGSFGTFNGLVRPGLVRLNTNGSVDLNFNTGAGVNGTVYAVAVQNDGKILVGGEFVSFNGTARTNLIRLNPNGSLDNTFNPNLSVDGGVRALVVQPDGLVVVGGSFTNVNGSLRRGLVRLLANGTVDPAFMNGLSGADDTVFAVQRQVDGKLVVAGAFRAFNGVTRKGITRLKTDGTTDPAINFGSGANAFVAALLIQPDRRIILGGGFTTYDDQPRAHITRIYGGSLDGAGNLEFSAPEYIASESGSNAVITVRRRFGTAGEVRVDVSTQGGSAVENVDYTGVTNTLIFPPGETFQSFMVPLIANTNPQPDRTVNLGLFNYVGALPGPQPVAVLIIQDDDPTVAFSTANYVVNENAVSGNATVTVLRSGGTNLTLTVDIATVAGGTATAGTDYNATNATLTFAPGEDLKLFNVRVFNDAVLEGNESILLALANASAGVTLGLANAELTLVDDELPNGQFLFATNNFVVDESAGLVNVNIIRTNGSVGIVSVRLITSNLTASAGSDYTPTNILVTFADGETNKNVPLIIINNAVAEPDETFLLTLSQPTGGATLLQTNAIVTIYDDEVLPSYVGFLTNAFYVNESAGFATISVVRTNSRRGILSVDFSVSNGTATSGVDYFTTNGTLVFNDSEDLKTFTIPIISDFIGEGDENVRLSLSNLQGTNAPTLVLPTADLFIVDDDTSVRFAAATYTVVENVGTAILTVERTGVSNNAISVTYATAAGGSALAGIDYVPVSGLLSWAAGDMTSRTVYLSIIDNNVLNQPKTVFLILTNAVGLAAYVAPPSNTVVTITDNEIQAPVAGPVDPLFNGNFGANGPVRALAYDHLRRLYVGGDFSQFHGLAVNGLVRLNTNGAVDINFNVGVGATGGVYSVAVVTNGVYVAGGFTNLNGVARGRVARLLPNGNVDAAFAPVIGANDTVRGAAVGTNGQLVIGGDFTTYDGVSAPRIARLTTNGVLDISFVTGSGPDLAVRAVAVQPNGQVLIGGDFNSYNGFLITRLARLNIDGSLDTTFVTGLGADGAVNSISVGPDGRIVIGGEFITFNGVPRNGVARLNADGSVDTGFDIGTGADAPVRAVGVELDNHVVVAGDFATFDGNPSAGVVRLNANGAMDAGFDIGAGADAPARAVALVPHTPLPSVAVMNFDALATNVTLNTHTENGVTLRGVSNGVVTTVARGAGVGARVLGSAGLAHDITVGGYNFTLQSILFTNLTGPVTLTSSSGGAVQITTNGLITFDSSFADVVWVRLAVGNAFDSVTIDDITAIPGLDALQPQFFAVGGDFEHFNHVQRGGVVVLTASGAAAASFDPRNIPTRAVYASAAFPSSSVAATAGKIAVGGEFTAIVGVDGVNHLARLNIDGTLDRAFNSGLGPNGTVRAVATQPDGKILFGGLFTAYDFIARAYLGRANVDGTLDNTFNFGAGLDNAVLALALQPDGRVIVGGLFTTVYGVSRNSVARVHTNGTVDVTFVVGSGANGAVKAVALQPDGKVLIGGDFTSYNGTPRAGIARLNSNGSIDLTFDPGTGAAGSVNAIALSGTQILIGGNFTTVNGNPAPRVARLSANGAFDGTFNVGGGANDYVSSVAVQADGRVVVGGNFTAFNGQIRNRLVRLNADGSLDATINFGAGANDFISTITLQDYDGKIVVGGGFTEFDGLTRVAIARLVGGTNSGAGAFRFSAPAFTVNERGSNAVITVVRSGGTTGSASVNYGTANGTATAPADYTATSGTLTFANAESVKQIQVPIIDNTVTTADRSFNIALSGATGGATIAAPSNAVVTIVENDNTIAFTSASYLAAENGAVARITVVRTGGAIDQASVDYATGTNGSATAGVDFTARAGTLVFGPGVRSRTFDVPLIDDGLNEFDETVPLALSLPVGASLGLSNATLTIVENDFGAGVITFRTAVYSGSEDGGGIVVELLRTNGYSGGVTVGYQTLTGSATAGVDYLATNGLVTFVDGQTNAFITIYPFDDALTEGNETVPVQLFGPSGTATLGLADATVTIIDNDAPGTFVFTAPEYSVAESGPTATITVLRTNGNLGGVSVTVQTSGGSATPGVDYQAVSNVLTFAAGQMVRTIVIPVFEDGNPEGTETVGLLLSNPTGGSSIGVPGTAILSILDNEASVGLALGALSVAESLTNFPVTLVRLGDTNVAFSVTLNTSDASATAGADYLAANTTVVFAPGETSRVVSVTVLDDTLAEGDESLNLTLSSPSAGVSLGPIVTGVLTILDNDTAFNFSSATYSTNEGTVDLAITIRRAGFSNSTVSVDYLTTDGTAVAPADYLTATGRVVFAPGQPTAAFTVRIQDDVLVENDETINLALANPSAGTFLGGQATAVITILDNDTTVGFSTTNYVVNEKATNTVITLVRNGSLAGAVSVGFRTQNGTALAGSDYAFTTQHVAWAAGDIAPKTVLIPVVDDVVTEGSETVLLLLSGPLGATIDPAAAVSVLSIVDDAGSISFASASSAAVEGAGDAVVNLVRTGGSNGVVSVQWSVTGGSATAGADYSGTVGTVVFAAGETVKPLLLPILEDGATEGIETVNLALSAPTGGARIGSPSAAVLSILDNDAGIIVGAGTALVSESFVPTNSVIEPNETVTLLFALRNSGLVDAGNVNATLVFANGVTNTTPQSQNYGGLVAGGNSVSRPFTFTALGTNGTRITATLMITNNGLFLGPVAFDFVLGSQSIPFQNAGFITLPASGQANPYPATITVSGVSGPLNKLTVTLNNVYHTYPDDLDIVLVGPNGAAVMLMSDAGSNRVLNGVSITIDDAAASALPDHGPIATGSYRGANYSIVSDSVPPFPGGTIWTNTSLATFNGINPNGVWSLYIFDDSPTDNGNIAGGWSLNISTADVVVPGADLAVSVTDAPDPVLTNSTFVYTIAVTNHGPAVATAVVLTNVLPANASFVSVAGPGSYALNGGVLTGSLGNLAVGSGTVVSVTMRAQNVTGQLTVDSTVASATADLNHVNNHASIKTSVVDGSAVPMLFAARKNNQLVLSWQGTATNIVLETSGLIGSGSWTGAGATPVVSNGVSTVTVPMGSGLKFYRLKRAP